MMKNQFTCDFLKESEAPSQTVSTTNAATFSCFPPSV